MPYPVEDCSCCGRVGVRGQQVVGPEEGQDAQRRIAGHVVVRERRPQQEPVDDAEMVRGKPGGAHATEGTTADRPLLDLRMTNYRPGGLPDLRDGQPEGLLENDDEEAGPRNRPQQRRVCPGVHPGTG